jgi:hypothetical protein
MDLGHWAAGMFPSPDKRPWPEPIAHMVAVVPLTTSLEGHHVH